MRFATVLSCLALLALPAAAGAQQSPFAPLPSAPTTGTPTVTVAAPSSSDSGGLKTWQEFLIFGAGLILIFGIGWAIVHDARARAPVSEAELAHPGMGATVTRQNRSRQQKQRARAKAKVGRAQRKRNRRR